MTRLLVHVEGPTEEAFVNEVLSHHLYERGFTSVSARIVGNARERTRRGGIVSWEIARQGILSRLIEDSNRISTTMVDYYAMPLDWPGRADRFAQAASSAQIAENIEQALLADICANMDRNFNPNRFVPYMMMHEFEAMLFSDCDSFGHSIGRSGLIADLQAIRDDFDTPEEIDDSPGHRTIQAHRESDARVSETHDGSSSGAEYRSGSDPQGMPALFRLAGAP